MCVKTFVKMKIIFLDLLIFSFFLMAEEIPGGGIDLSSKYLTVPFGSFNGEAIYDHLDVRQGTVEFWLKPLANNKKNGELSGFFFWGNGSNNNSMSVYCGNKGNRIYFQVTGLDHNAVYLCGPALSEKSWHHIAVTWENTGGQTYNLTLFVDGSPAKTLKDEVGVSDNLKRDIYIGLCKRNTKIDTLRTANADMAMFRISKNVRYSKAFQASSKYGVDAETICFFPFNGNDDLKGFFYISENKNGTVNAVKHKIEKREE